MKDTQIKIKNNVQGMNSKVGETNNQIRDWKYKEAQNTQSEQGEKRIQKNEDSARSLWDTFNCSNIPIMGMPDREERQ